ncbi:MAG: cache domain-containing protein [Desulfosarcina sp.]|nr:cache domain-containing protein [Desulfosarcina sp.]
MKRSIQISVIIVILISCFTAQVWAESATKEEVIAKCEEAAKLVQEKGLELAGQTIGDKAGPFVWKDTYVFLMDLDGKMLAHPIKPELTERADILEVKDTDGKPLFVEFVEVAGKKGEGWVDYMWPKPGEENPVAKSSYIYRVEGTPYFVGAGIYK